MNQGIGFFGILAITFIILKLCGVIKWSWWLVLLPLYGGLVMGMLIMGLFLLLSGIILFCNNK